jgi:hypothetical protein
MAVSSGDLKGKSEFRVVRFTATSVARRVIKANFLLSGGRLFIAHRATILFLSRPFCPSAATPLIATKEIFQ